MSISLLVFILLRSRNKDLSEKKKSNHLFGLYVLSLGLFAFYINFSNAERGTKKLEALNSIINFFYKNRQEIYVRSNTLKSMNKNVESLKELTIDRVSSNKDNDFLMMYERSIPIKNKCEKISQIEINKVCNDLVSWALFDLDYRINNNSWGNLKDSKGFLSNESSRLNDLKLICKENVFLELYIKIIPLASKTMNTPKLVSAEEKTEFQNLFTKLSGFRKTHAPKQPFVAMSEAISYLGEDTVLLMSFDKKLNTAKDACYQTIYSIALRLRPMILNTRKNYYLLASEKSHFSTLILSTFDNGLEEKIFFLNPYNSSKYFCLETYKNGAFEFCGGENL